MARGSKTKWRVTEILPVSLEDPEQIQEFVEHSWYRYPDSYKVSAGLHPFDGVTDPYYALGANAIGTPTDIRQLDERERYSWIKTPRWRGNMMEVGPLARTLIAYHSGKGDMKAMVDEVCGRLNVAPDALKSTLGRILTRALETRWAAHTMRKTYNQLISNLKNGDASVVNVEKWEPSSWPHEAKGMGFAEAPRGALGHWVRIRDKRIENYQCVVPTTWNAAPRSPSGQLGPYEAALMNTRMDELSQPLEILRTVHSFDPCLACSTHLLGAQGKELGVVYAN